MTRSPTQATRDGPRLSLVPDELPFNSTDVIEHGFDLDHQEATRNWIDREQIDPPMRSPFDDFDLTNDLPSLALESALYISDASSMGCVSLTSGASNKRQAKGELDLQPQDFAHRQRRTERDSGSSQLGFRYERLGHPGTPRELSLAPADGGARLANGTRCHQPKCAFSDRSSHDMNGTTRRSPSGYRRPIT
jgi:hypothetical protein